MADADRTTDNRDRILRTAERLFAERGFDATSVGSIAREAGVNKALIYYYFESKDHLLTSLFGDLRSALSSHSGAAEDASLPDKIAREVDVLKGHRRTLALMLMQALREGDQTPALFEVAGELIAADLAARGFEQAAADEQYQEALVHEFFTGVVPVVAFVALRDRFSAHFGLDAEQAEALFLRALERSHFASHVPPEPAE